jgi:hypothetical protein
MRMTLDEATSFRRQIALSVNYLSDSPEGSVPPLGFRPGQDKLAKGSESSWHGSGWHSLTSLSPFFHVLALSRCWPIEVRRHLWKMESCRQGRNVRSFDEWTDHDTNCFFVWSEKVSEGFGGISQGWLSRKRALRHPADAYRFPFNAGVYGPFCVRLMGRGVKTRRRFKSN